MTLRQKQSLFFRPQSRMSAKIEELGLEATFGEALRPQFVADIYAHFGVGSKTSLHILKLAMDVLLFRDGRYLTSTESYRELGEWWEEQHIMCRWGGRFGDGNHFSLEHGGHK